MSQHLLSLDLLSKMSARFGYQVALTDVPATVQLERCNDTVLAEFHDDGTCSFTKKGVSVSLDAILVDAIEVVGYLHQDGPYWIVYRNGHFLSRHLNEIDAVETKAALEAPPKTSYL